MAKGFKQKLLSIVKQMYGPTPIYSADCPDVSNDHVLRKMFRRCVDSLVRAQDPTLLPPPSYTKIRADQVLKEAFRRSFEYLVGTSLKGEVLEFGTFRGYTARVMAELMAELNYDANLYLYDSFMGLPQIDDDIDKESYEVKDNKVWFRGQMQLYRGIDQRIGKEIGKIILPSRLQVVKGYYEDTLLSNLPKSKVALVHVDCDLYSSAKYVLDILFEKNLLQDGCLILCDDYNCNRANPFMGERQAMREAFEAQNLYTYEPFFSYGWHGWAFIVHSTQQLARQ